MKNQTSCSVLVGFLLVVVACGSGGDGPDGPDDPDATPPTNIGLVFISEQHNTSGTTGGGFALATFYYGPIYGGPVASEGGCDYYNNTNVEGETAGPIAISGTTTAITLFPSGPTAPVTYAETPTAPVDFFAPGATITVAASGDVVPAFAADVVAPPAVAGMMFPASLSRSASATFTWTSSATAAEMWLQIGNATGQLWCRTADTGTFTVTAEALGLLPANIDQAFMMMLRTETTRVPAGAWGVDVVAADGAQSLPTPLNP